MRQETITVTPELANEWLKKNIERNRKVRASDVSKYARDMRAGRWELTPQGIIFNESGNLMDGQHRLWAVVEAGVPVDMVVWFDVPDEMVHVIDSGVSRKMTDHMGFLSDETAIRDKNVIASFTFLMKTALDYPSAYKFSAQELYGLMMQYHNTVSFLHKMLHLHKGSVVNSAYFVGILAALANNVPMKSILAFDRKVIDGELDDEDSIFNGKAAHEFRVWYEGNSKKKKSAESQRYIYEQTKKAIYCFVNNKKNTKYSHYEVNPHKLNILNSFTLDSKKSNNTEENNSEE